MAVAFPAFCYGCDKVLCREHLDTPAHQDGCRNIAPTLEKFDMTFEDALQDLDPEALVAEVNAMRPGHTLISYVIPDTKDIPEDCHGGLNIHITLMFEDGVEWMLRLSGYDRAHHPFPVLEVRRESEVATMMALQEVTDLVAKVHGWGVGKISKTQDRRCVYIIFDKKQGAADEGFFIDFDNQPEVSQATKLKFIEGYADFSIQVSSLTYDRIGSLTIDRESQNIKVGPWIDPQGVGSATEPYFPGPFKSMRDRYITHIDLVLGATREGLMGRGRPLLTYLAHLVAKDLVMGCEELAKEDKKFYIRQPDASGGQCLVTEDGGLTAVLDWEFANTTCKTHAFCATEAIFNTEAWLCGDNAMTEGEIMLCEVYDRRGRPDLSHCVRSGRKYQRLEYILGRPPMFLYDGPNGSKWLLGWLNGMVDSFLGDQAAPLPTSREAWIEWALAQHSDDPGLPEIMELEGKSALYRYRSWSPKPAAVESAVEADVSSQISGPDPEVAHGLKSGRYASSPQAIAS